MWKVRKEEKKEKEGKEKEGNLVEEVMKKRNKAKAENPKNFLKMRLNFLMAGCGVGEESEKKKKKTFFLEKENFFEENLI